MSTAGPFSLLLEWLSDPVVSGCMALLGCGLITQFVLWPLVLFFDKRNRDSVCFCLALTAIVLGIAAFVCAVCFNDWAGAING